MSTAGRPFPFRKSLLTTALCAALAGTPLAHAESAPQAVNIQATELADALNQLAVQYGVQLSYSADLLQNQSSQGLRGRYSLEQSLDQLLAHSGLRWRYAAEGVVTLEKSEPSVDIGRVIVSATRSPEDVLKLPNAVTVLEREQIEQLAHTSNGLGDLLSRAVPGLATSAESQSSYSQTLRGRALTVLIDGVPQSGALRNSSRDLVLIDPQMIERIEVLRGPTGVYGYGATGGLINIITRAPEAGELQFTTEAGISLQEADGDSFSQNLFQQVQGSQGDTRYIASARYSNSGLFYDADGDAIPVSPHGQGGLSDAKDYDLYCKIEHDLSDQETLTFSASLSKIEQDNDYHSINGVYGQQKTTLGEGPEANSEGQATRNRSFNLQYQHDSVLNSQLTAQLYTQAGWARNKFNTKLAGQSITESDKTGLRLTLNTPLAFGYNSAVLWGLDYTREEADQHFTDGRQWTPLMEQDSTALFANLEVGLSEQWIARAGVRYDRFDLSVEDFTSTGGKFVEGGDIDYNEVTWNAGLSYLINDHLTTYASFSQGYSVPDIGRILRDGSNDSLAQLDPEAQLVDNYELGIKGDWQDVQTSLALFYNESDLGLRFTGDANSTNFSPRREPEKVYGIEATLDWQPSNLISTGLTATWLEGKVDTDLDGSYDDYLGGERIPPLKLTAYLQHQTSAQWSNRIDLLYSGNRDRFSERNDAADAGTGKRQFGEGKVDDFLLVDISSRYQLGEGVLKAGISNLFDTDYFTVESQSRNRDAQYAKGRGRTLNLSYQLNW